MANQTANRDLRTANSRDHQTVPPVQARSSAIISALTTSEISAETTQPSFPEKKTNIAPYCAPPAGISGTRMPRSRTRGSGIGLPEPSP
jgi:hypothetical protein